LVCANSLSVKEAAFLLHERGKAMQNSVPVGHGAMIAVLGMTINEIFEVIKSIKSNGICEIANDNCPGQVVVSGDKQSIDLFQNELKKRSKKSVFLPVSAPFHCSLMKKAEVIMKKKIDDTKFKNPTPTIISNVSAVSESNADNIKNLLVKQITSKVRWRESIEYMIKNNVSKFIEIGPGKVLSGLVKRINKNVEIKNLCNIEEIENYLKNV
jgi:[acyl-carrier-protein] S-malonyltransferase